MIDHIELQGLTTKKNLAEVGEFLIPHFIVYTIITASVCLGGLCLFFIQRSMAVSIFLLFCTVFMSVLYQYSIVVIVNRKQQTITDFFHVSELIYQLSFRKDCIYIIISNISDQPIEIAYSAIYGIVETENLYLMLTEALNPIFVLKGSYTDVSKADWETFLIEKCIHVRKIKRSK